MAIDTMNTNPYLPNLLNGGTPMNPMGRIGSRDKELLRRMLNHKHMVETLERFKWEGLPPELNSDLIERILYFRFKGALFYDATLEKYFFLPFTLVGGIDYYGRYNKIQPVLFTGSWTYKDNKFAKDIAYVSEKPFTVAYDVNDIKEGEDYAVILTDSSLAISQDYTPMEYLIRPVIEQMTDIWVLVNMDLISSAKMFYIVAQDENQKLAIEKEFENLDDRILNGKRVVVLTSSTELRELTGGSAKDTARYFQSYQSIDNLRKDIIGQINGGTFMKQEHTTEMETQANSNSGSLVLQNALRMRQEFADIANHVFGLSISVDTNIDESTDMIEEEGAQTEQLEGGYDE